MAEAYHAPELCLHAGLLGHLALHRRRQVLLRVEQAARQLVVGLAAVPAIAFVHHQQALAGVDHHAAGADVVGGVVGDVGVAAQRQGHHQLARFRVVKREPRRRGDRHQRGGGLRYLQPDQPPPLPPPGGDRGGEPFPEARRIAGQALRVDDDATVDVGGPGQRIHRRSMPRPVAEFHGRRGRCGR